MDFEERQTPYNSEEEFGRRETRTNGHKSSEPISLEDSVRK